MPPQQYGSGHRSLIYFLMIGCGGLLAFVFLVWLAVILFGMDAASAF